YNLKTINPYTPTTVKYTYGYLTGGIKTDDLSSALVQQFDRFLDQCIRILIRVIHRFFHTFHQVFTNDHVHGTVQCIFGRTQLSDHIFAVPALLNHLQRTVDLPLQTVYAVDYRLIIDILLFNSHPNPLLCNIDNNIIIDGTCPGQIPRMVYWVILWKMSATMV